MLHTHDMPDETLDEMHGFNLHDMGNIFEAGVIIRHCKQQGTVHGNKDRGTVFNNIEISYI